MDAAAIIDAIQAQSGTDASRATLLSILNEVYAQQVVRSRWLLETVTISTTTAGTSDYSLSDTAFDISVLRVNGQLLDPATTEQYWDLQAGNARLTRSAGVWALTYSSSGGTSVSIYPTPDTDGYTIDALVPATASALTDVNTSTPVTPSDTHGSLIDGATALVLLRVDERPDLADAFQARFERATEELRRRKNSRGGGSVQIQIAGVHFAA